MSKGRQTDDPVRAAVISALLAGQGVSQIARELKLSKATVSRIKNTVGPKHLEQVETEKRDKITALIESHLETSLTCANELAKKATSNQAWFDKQTASEIAVLYGVLTDKSLRILEAIQPEADPAEDEEEET
ncbi:MAG: helix-turn-helix domain-containing protein [Blastocatellia bacterium]